MQRRQSFGELTPSALDQVTEIASTAVRILWVDDFYDGPLSGIAEWAGCRFRFELVDRSVLGDEVEARRYWLIKLSSAQLAEEDCWQELFCTHVWTGFDYRGRRQHTAPHTEHAKFYDLYAARIPPDYSGNEVVGWFQS